MSQNNLLLKLTFIGGTCLRACYGGTRLSEDIDFTGGTDFSRDTLSKMGNVLTNSLQEKYGLKINVSEPIKDKNNVDTWKIKIENRPKQKHLPAQRINIDICKVTSYEKQPMLLLNPYNIDMGTSGLIIQAQSREEIYADKLLAFALRANRIKNRDLWDIVWLHQQGVIPNLALIPNKLKDRQLTQDYFLNQYQQRQMLLTKDNNLQMEFDKEMQRFLPQQQAKEILKQNNFWEFIVYLISDLGKQLK